MGGRGAQRLVLLAGLAAPATLRARAEPQPNPPAWPKGVYVWGPDTPADEITQVANEAFTTNGGHEPEDHGQFSPLRFAFMFKPGTYHVDVPIGFYTQVLGLGDQPGDVVFDAPRGPYSEEGDQDHMGGALSSFWRSVENFQTRSSMLWAVSQAAPMRRVIVDKDLNLAQYVDGVGMGYASGGFLGNVEIGGKLYPGSQQQFCVRNGDFVGGWSGGVWNMAFIGSKNAPEAHCGHDDGMPFVTVDQTPVIAEKPFITIDEAGKFYLNVPPSQRDRVGTDFDAGLKIPFEEVYVAQEGDSAADINRHLDQGLHLVLPAGIWELDEPLKVGTKNQVVLGLGLATLVSTAGNAVIQVGSVDGVRIAGVLLQAGETLSETLLQWGDDTAFKGDPENPGYASDLFARVGGPWDPAEKQQRSRLMVQISSGNVVGDNFWLWRGDHWGKPSGEYGLVRDGDNRCDTGLEVTGDDVTIYGLAVEHTLKDLTVWGGQGGRVYFYQSELPYDVNQDWGDAGYVGYRVLDSVGTHEAHGIGVYHYFRDYAVTVQSGIACPEWLENSFDSPLSVYLTGKGKVLHILNDRGDMTGDGSQVTWLCDKAPPVEAPANLPTTTKRPRKRGTLVVKRKAPSAAEKPAPPTVPSPKPVAPMKHSGNSQAGLVEALPPGTAADGEPSAEVEGFMPPAGADDDDDNDDDDEPELPLSAGEEATAADVAGPFPRPSARHARGAGRPSAEAAEPAEPAGAVVGALTRQGYDEAPLNPQQGEAGVPWWAWVVMVQTCGTWALCAYVFLLYRRCAGSQENGDLPRIAASPFLFRGLPAWSPGIAQQRGSSQSPQLQARGVAAWDTPEEKVRRTNSSKASGGRGSGPAQAQSGQEAADDDNGKAPADVTPKPRDAGSLQGGGGPRQAAGTRQAAPPPPWPRRPGPRGGGRTRAPTSAAI
ncbi:unnamed protein product [Prorocentrum cordatum]|uniref:Uncharacterized protein n=1 Tax=Prorocentrum cordatum TaxID=2364126 RepID=A0ABN9QY11_9DINO|nr:unnamed protein product [Polarella glacialis]